MKTNLEAAFVAGVTAAAWIWPPLALVVAAAFWIGVEIANDRRAKPQ